MRLVMPLINYTMKHSNISLFVPHAGCPNQCSFCNQKTISGSVKELTKEEVRETLMFASNSNLSSENYNDVLTLSHFTDYVSHYEKSDILTSDGTRDATLNTPLKRELEKASDGSSSHYTIIDLNDFYTRGIHTKSDKEIKDYINNSEEQAFKAKQKMQRIAKENPKNRVTTAKKKSFHER